MGPGLWCQTRRGWWIDTVHTTKANNQQIDYHSLLSSKKLKIKLTKISDKERLQSDHKNSQQLPNNSKYRTTMQRKAEQLVERHPCAKWECKKICDQCGEWTVGHIINQYTNDN